MGIVLVHSRADLSDFKLMLQKKLPNTTIQLVQEVQNPDEIEYAISWKHPHGIFSKFQNLKVIASFGAGVDHIFSDPELPKNIQITKIVNKQLTKDMCDFILMHCLNYLRNTNNYFTNQQQLIWQPMRYLAPKDVRVGILGLGTLGSAVALHLTNQNFKVSGWSNSKKNIKGVNCFSKNELNSMLQHTDILICLLPLTSETKGILNYRMFKQLPKGSCVINVARGQHLNEHDLKKAIEEGIIKAAFLDVFQNEPLLKDHWFWKHKAIHLTPHVASITKPAEVVTQLVSNYKRFKSDKPLMNNIDLKKGY